MNAKDTNARQRDYYERMKAAGLKKVCVYVPAGKVKALQAAAAKLRGKEKAAK